MSDYFGVIESETGEWVAGTIIVGGFSDEPAHGVTPQDAINAYWEKRVPPVPQEDTLVKVLSQIHQLAEAVQDLSTNMRELEQRLQAIEQN